VNNTKISSGSDVATKTLYLVYYKDAIT